MPVPEADHYLSVDPSMTAAFDRAKQMHLAHVEVAKTPEGVLSLPETVQKEMVGDFVFASVAFFANRGHDQYMQELGTTVWRGFKDGAVALMFAPDVAVAATELGLPPREASGLSGPEPVFLTREGRGASGSDEGYLLTPPDYISRAINLPVEALATMSGNFSRIRDFVNGRHLNDPLEHTIERMKATVSHFVIEAKKQNPTMLSTPLYRRLAREYPVGIVSLPRALRYTAGQRPGPSSADRN